MLRLLINSTEQIQPDNRNDTLFKLYGRPLDDPTERKEVTVHGFRPYFYAGQDEIEELGENYLLSQDSIQEIEPADVDPFIDDADLCRIYTPYPQDVRDAKELFDNTWNADVPFTNRLRIDTGMRAIVEVPSETCHWREIKPVEPGSSGAKGGGSVPKPRMLTFDIEVDDRGDGFPTEGDERILSIVAHDSYSGDVAAFIDESDVEGDITAAPDDVDEVLLYEDEQSMLYGFTDWFRECDPDLITGWNVDDFDVPYLIERMRELNVPESRLSPLGWAGFSSRGDPRIKGRTIYDMLTVYRKNQFTNLREYSLDYVAKQELGEEKVEFEGSYYDLYRSDPEKFLEYNAKDVTLVVEIDEEAGVVDFRDQLRREIGVDFEDSYDNKDFVDMMCRRKLKEMGKVGPTRPPYGEEPDSDYEGGFVLEPFEGVETNVVGVDLASLYPYTMAMLNASPDTKVTEPSAARERGLAVAEADNGQHFRLDEDGLFKQLVDEAISLKAEYKQRRNEAETEEEYEKWAQKYAVAKTITNSLYGVTGWERFFLYDEDVAEAVTLTGQAVIKATAEYIQETGYEVIYGDSVPAFEPVTIRNAHGDIDVLPIEEVWEKFQTGRRFEVWCDGGWSLVQDAIRKPNRKRMYRVRTGDGVVHVTEDHGLLHPDGSEATPTELNVGDKLMHTVHDHPSFNRATADTDEDTAWLWGLFAGDGTCGKYDCDSGTKRQWKISGDTKEYLDRAAEILEQNGYTPRIEYINSDDHTGRLLVSEVSELVDKYRDRFYTNGGKKRVPRSILNGTEDVKRAFLSGYQAADGGKDERYDKIFHRSYTNSETLAQGIAVLLQSLGLECGVNVRDNYGKEYTRIWSRQRGGGTTIKEIEQIEYGGDYVYDLSTESEHFNAGVGTITVHNTDSCYISFPDEWDRDRCLGVANELCLDLNDTIYSELARERGIPPEDNLWEIETEAYMLRYFQAGKKKRYAYLATWKDGHEIDDPEPVIKGFSSKRSDSAQLTVQTETAVFDAILSGAGPDAVRDIIFDAAQQIERVQPDWSLIGIPGGLKKHITDDPERGATDDYYAVSSNGDHPQDAHPRAAWNANQILGTDIGKGDKPKRVYLEPTEFAEVERRIDVIGFESETDLSPVEGRLRVDVPRMTDTLLVSPLDEVGSALGIDVSAAVKGHEQTGLGAFEQG